MDAPESATGGSELTVAQVNADRGEVADGDDPGERHVAMGAPRPAAELASPFDGKALARIAAVRDPQVADAIATFEAAPEMKAIAGEMELSAQTPSLGEPLRSCAAKRMRVCVTNTEGGLML